MEEISNQPQGHVYVALKPPLSQSLRDDGREFIEAMRLSGISFKGDLIADGAIHRFVPGGRGNKDGWYVFYGMAGAFGDWSQDIHEKWSLNHQNLSYQDKETLRLQIEKAKKSADKERLYRYEEAAALALAKWNTFDSDGYSPYLVKKKIEAFGVRFKKDFLIIPICDTANKLWSLQWIAPDGTKRFLTGGRKKGCFHHIGDLIDGNPIIVTEGYATSASIHMAIQQTTVIAFDAGNLDLIIEELKKAYPRSSILIAGDDDQWKEQNVGRDKAEQAAFKHGCSVVFPKFRNTNTKPTDFNDLYILEGPDEVKKQLCEILCTLSTLSSSDPVPVESKLFPVLPFTLDMVPEPLQPWIKDIAHRRQCPLDFVAIPVIIMVASLIGARCSIKPNEKDDWTVTPNLWGGILGDPGTLKSPICSEVLFPFGYLENKAKEDYLERKSQYDAEKAAFIESKNTFERKIKDLIEKSTSDINTSNEIELKLVKDQLADLLKKCPSEPAFKRYKVSDTTLEKMHEILSQNPGGVLIFRDELMGFLESWEKKGHESDRSFYLEAWNGDKPYKMDRIGRGTIYAANICVSILGTTQPDKIATYLQKALMKLDNDGLLQRFQLLVYPDKKPWQLIDEYPSSFARNRVFHICKTIDEMIFTEHGAKEPDPLFEGQHTIPYFRFSREAQTYFHEWIKKHQEKLDGKSCTGPRKNEEHPIIIQHLSKYRSLMPSLSLIFHLINIADGKKENDISLDVTQKAAACCAYLESHARRIYGMVLDTTFESFPRISKAEELLAWMKKQTNSPDKPLTRRFIMRYSKFRSSKDLDPLLSDLIQMGYIKEEPQCSFCILS